MGSRHHALDHLTTSELIEALGVIGLDAAYSHPRGTLLVHSRESGERVEIPMADVVDLGMLRGRADYLAAVIRLIYTAIDRQRQMSHADATNVTVHPSILADAVAR